MYVCERRNSEFHRHLFLSKGVTPEFSVPEVPEPKGFSKLSLKQLPALGCSSFYFPEYKNTTYKTTDNNKDFFFCSLIWRSTITRTSLWTVFVSGRRPSPLITAAATAFLTTGWLITTTPSSSPGRTGAGEPPSHLPNLHFCWRTRHAAIYEHGVAIKQQSVITWNCFGRIS